MIDRILARNNVNVLGNGSETIMFAHGFGCDQNMWRFVAPAFSDNYRIVLFDYVGSGLSDYTAYDPVRYSTLNGYAQDVLEICDALDLSKVIFVGHSVSSVIGMLASIREPGRFSQLVLIGPSPRYLNDLPGYQGGFERNDIEGLLDMMESNFVGWAEFLAPVVMKNADRAELNSELVESFCKADPDIARRFAEATFLADNRNDLPLVSVPSLILQCAEDSIAPRAVGEFVHAHLAGSTFHQMDATGHCPHMSHPDETTRVIREYLRRNSGRGLHAVAATA